MLLGVGENFLGAQGLTDCNSFGDRRFHVHGDGVVLSLLSRLIQRITKFTLKRNDLRKVINGAALQEMLQRLHDADVERAVADRHNDVLRDPPQLFERFIDVTLHAFVEVRIHHMVGVVNPFFCHPGATHVGTVIPRSRHDMRLRTRGFDHGNFLGARTFGHIDFALNPGAGTVGRDGVTGVAA